MSGTGDLKIVVKGIKDNQGHIIISLFNSAAGFPGNNQAAYRTASLTISGNKVEYTFKNVPLGIYAVAAYHDRNGNNKLDKSFFGIPAEGVGASNNAKGHMGPPKFENAKFNFPYSGFEETITLDYL